MQREAGGVTHFGEFVEGVALHSAYKRVDLVRTMPLASANQGKGGPEEGVRLLAEGRELGAA